MSGLSDAEKEAVYAPLYETGCYGFIGDHPELEAAIAQLLAARAEQIAQQIEAQAPAAPSKVVTGSEMKQQRQRELWLDAARIVRNQA